MAALEARRSTLSGAEAQVADVLARLGDGIVLHSVTEIAQQAGTAAATVVRCCRRLGYRGFQDFKLAVARGGSPRVPVVLVDEVNDDDEPAAILAKVAASTATAVTEGTANVDPRAFERAVELLAGAQRLLFAGVGTSAPVAQDAAYRFLTIGSLTEAPADVHIQHVRARLLTPDSVCIAVSHTGATRETTAVAQAARDAGAPVIAVTSFSRSPLTDIADIALVAAGRETRHRVEAMSSRIAHITVLDALFVAVTLRQLKRAEAAQSLTADVLTDHRY